jgi:glycosyltransferase involved in cell wall biosynthesis
VSALSNVVSELEILIVDDGGTDATGEICDRLASRYPVVRIIPHPRNRGYGAALRSGFAAARYDLVFFTESDGQFRFGQVAEFIAQIDAVHMVLGYRADRQGQWLYEAKSFLGNWLARTLFGVRVRDINCAYKLFHRHFLERLPLTSERAMINMELLALAAQAGWTFHEIAVVHYPRKSGAGAGAKFQGIVRTLAEYFQLQGRIALLRRS